ncbi:MAG: branched-chain amino acid ABC transporter permease, partial [Epsilonproteobacteria bacterium]|nr:branched-chain amino acid ABC transporter permease [Campylobacterota bacterium]
MELFYIITKREIKAVLVTALFLVFLFIFFKQDDFLLTTVSYGLLIAVLSFGWNLSSLAGDISLGHTGFFGIGAYVAVISGFWGVNSLISILLGASAAALYGAFISLSFYRLAGISFALASIAFAEIPKVIVENLDITGGDAGIINIKPLLIIKPIDTPLRQYLMGIVLLIVLLVFMIFISRKIWLRFSAIRQNSMAAKALGIPAVRYRQISMIISSFIFGFVGAIWTYWTGYINPDSAFNLYFSTAPFISALFGG